MQRNSGNLVCKAKAVVLSVAVVGALHASACTIGDLQHNVVNGTLSFVKGYTTDVWEALVPPVDDLVGE